MPDRLAFDPARAIRQNTAPAQRMHIPLDEICDAERTGGVMLLAGLRGPSGLTTTNRYLEGAEVGAAAHISVDCRLNKGVIVVSGPKISERDSRPV